MVGRREALRRARARQGAAGREIQTPGQKLFFWVQSLLGVVFVATGLLLWFPESFGTGLLNTMRLLHYAAALAAGLLLILHVYLGTVAYPGTARGMIDGKVTTAWARLHHPRWSGDRVEQYLDGASPRTPRRL